MLNPLFPKINKTKLYLESKKMWKFVKMEQSLSLLIISQLLITQPKQQFSSWIL